MWHVPIPAACLTCGTELARSVRAAIFDATFAPNLALTLLPIAVMLAIVAGIRFAPSFGRVRRRGGGRSDAR